MGIILCRLFSSMESERPCKLLMVGLDDAGKSTILYKLKLGEIVTTSIVATVGYNVETVKYKNISLTVWDIGDYYKIWRARWQNFLNNAQGIIYVIDSNDTETFPEARETLHTMLQSNELENCPLLVLANKQDLPGAVKTEVLVEALGLKDISDRPWFIQSTCARNGDGIFEGFDWFKIKNLIYRSSK